jgi:hypothetical protein
VHSRYASYSIQNAVWAIRSTIRIQSGCFFGVAWRSFSRRSSSIPRGAPRHPRRGISPSVCAPRDNARAPPDPTAVGHTALASSRKWPTSAGVVFPSARSMSANQSAALPSGGPSGGGVVVDAGVHPAMTMQARTHATQRPSMESALAMSLFIQHVRIRLGSKSAIARRFGRWTPVADRYIVRS